MSQTAGESTLNTGDTINGNGLTTVSLIVDAGAATVQPIADINNVASININLATSTTAADGILDMAEFDGVAQVAITQGTNAQILGVANAQVDTTYAINIARTVTLDITGFEDDTGDADTITFAANGAGTADATRATFDLSGGAIETVAVTTTGTNFVQINGGGLVDTYTVSGTGTSDISIAAAAANMTVDASGNSGTNVFRIGALLTSLDTITGGSGTDTLRATANVGTTRATISAIETLRFDFADAGATQDLRNVTGATTLTLTGDESATVTRAASTIATINLASTTSTGADDVSVTFAAGSDTATALRIGTTNDAGDAVVSTGTVTIAGNEGALTVSSIGDDANAAEDIIANDVAAITLITTQELSVTGGGGGDDISAASAVTATFTTAGGDLSVDDDVILTDATTVTVNAEDGDVTIGGSLITAADAAEVTVIADDNDVTIALIDAEFATSFSFAATAGAGITVTDIETLGEDSDEGDIDNLISLSALGADSTVDVTIAAFAAAGTVDLVTITTDEDGAATFTVGVGTNVTISEVDASASAGTTSIDLSGAVAAAEVSTGAGDATVILTASADTFIGGAGDDTVTGGDGADDITLGAGDDTVIITTNLSIDTVGDFEAGASSDNVSFSVAALNAIFDLDTEGFLMEGGGAAVVAGDAAVIQVIEDNEGEGEALDAGTNVVFVDGAFASAAAVQTAIETGGANEITLTGGAGDAFILMYQDTSGNVQVATVVLDNAVAGTVILAGDAVTTNVITLVGVDVADIVAGNFAFIA